MNESASSYISGLTLTTENCDEAVKILEERFANTQIVTSAFMHQFVSLPKIKSVDDISGLRKLLVPLINEKLPNDLKLLIACQSNSDVWSLSKMLEDLKKEI